jgi:hypothetical protein
MSKKNILSLDDLDFEEEEKSKKTNKKPLTKEKNVIATTINNNTKNSKYKLNEKGKKIVISPTRDDLEINIRIFNTKREEGTIRYIGFLKSDKLEYVGIEWDKEGMGIHEGEYNGKSIFYAKNKTAMFMDVKYYY